MQKSCWPHFEYVRDVNKNPKVRGIKRFKEQKNEVKKMLMENFQTMF